MKRETMIYKREMCNTKGCGHSDVAHTRQGKGRCMIQGCGCGKFQNGTPETEASHG